MKNVMVMVTVVLLASLSVNAALVDTYFDNWATPTVKGGDWGGQIDSASSVAWSSNNSGNDYSPASWASLATRAGTVGVIRSKDGGSYTQLHFGNAGNNGVYQITWWQIVNDRGETHPDKVGRTGFYAEGWAELTVVKMDDANGKIYVTTNTGDLELLSSMSNDTWYEYEMTANVPAHTFSIKVKKEGDANWTELSNQSFKDGLNVGSLAVAKCFVSGGGSNETHAFLNGYDNIKVDVVPEPVTIALLGIGGLLFARKKR